MSQVGWVGLADHRYSRFRSRQELQKVRAILDHRGLGEMWSRDRDQPSRVSSRVSLCFFFKSYLFISFLFLFYTKETHSGRVALTKWLLLLSVHVETLGTAKWRTWSVVHLTFQLSWIIATPLFLKRIFVCSACFMAPVCQCENLLQILEKRRSEAFQRHSTCSSNLCCFDHKIVKGKRLAASQRHGWWKMMT